MNIRWRELNQAVHFSIVVLTMLLLSGTGALCGQKKQISAPQTISDMVLIYHGGIQRLAWSSDQLKPYLYRERSGKTEWLFDKFLFLEIFDNIQKYNYDPGFGYKTAGKEQWQWLLNRYFALQKGPDALEFLLDSLSKQGKTPIRQREVVISIPCPVNGFTEWGELNGKKMNFNNPEDQEKAACWFIDEAIKKWNEKNYKHIKLSGFYWVHEDAAQSSEAIAFVRKYLEKKNYQLLWIPYWGAEGKGGWQKLGFDFAWQQPNYFFETTIPKQRLTDACSFAKEHRMGLEMEFDERVSKSEFRERFYDYVNSFKENHVWSLCPVAYYEGGGAWLQMVNSSDPEMKKMVDILGDIIVERQLKEDKMH